MPTIKSGYEPHDRVQVVNNKKSLAKQSMQAECDINNIMTKFYKTGLASHVNKYAGSYDALPSHIDYHDAQNAIIAAEEAFSSLPAKLRSKWDNDPEKFLEFVDDPKNEDEIYDLGLAQRPPDKPKPVVPSPPAPPEVPPTAPPVGE